MTVDWSEETPTAELLKETVTMFDVRRRAGWGEAWRTFLALAAMESEDCITWPFYRTTHGHGQVWHPDRRRLALVHRLALERRSPPPTPDLEAAHGPCHNPACMNYRHLRWATHAENEADKVRDGTSNRGGRGVSAKFTESQVVTMRRLHADGVTQAEIGRRFGTSQPVISRIVRAESWAWLS